MNLIIPNTCANARTKFAKMFAIPIQLKQNHCITSKYLTTHTYADQLLRYTTHLRKFFVFCNTFICATSRWERSIAVKKTYGILCVSVFECAKYKIKFSVTKLSVYVCANWISRFTHNRIVGGISESFQRQPFAHTYALCVSKAAGNNNFAKYHAKSMVNICEMCVKFLRQIFCATRCCHPCPTSASGM